ncbi:MAG: translation initiation factor IF-3, partial [Alphaproteobacteria bacterium]|nr:translation initiation factor IF-3 [Alphaproteobacteria bacterium]
MPAPAPAKDGPRVNEDIRSRTILLIGDDGHKYGELGIDEGIAIAEERGLDLVEVSPEAKPPVVKLM